MGAVFFPQVLNPFALTKNCQVFCIKNQATKTTDKKTTDKKTSVFLLKFL